MLGTRQDLEPQSEPINIMYDPRVVRGNTYSAKILTSNIKDAFDSQKLTSPTKFRKKVMSKRSQTPPPVDGRVHMNIQTETFLEELSDRPIEKDAETQTHIFLDRPPSPLFIPAKTGIDASTQILPGELFIFDLEVEPILEVLVGKTIQSAMLELMQEEELDAIRRQQYEYEMIRDSELAEVKRLEAEQIRQQQEKNRRITEATLKQKERKELNEKMIAKKLSMKVLQDIQNDVFNRLYEEGYFYDPIEKEIEELYFPELIQSVTTRMNNYQSIDVILEDILLSLVEDTKIIEKNEIKQREEEKENKRIQLEEEAKVARLAEEERLKQLHAEEETKHQSNEGDGENTDE